MSDLEGESGKKYEFTIYNKNKESIIVDVYDIIDSLDIRCPAIQQLIKKALFTGTRGIKTITQDLYGITSASIRAIELHETRKHVLSMSFDENKQLNTGLKSQIKQ